MKAIRIKMGVIGGGIIIGSLYLGLFNRTPHGTKCIRSISPDGVYLAERCFLQVESYRTEDTQYVARLFDAKSGNLLAEHVFTTPVPDFYWSPGFYSGEPEPRYIGPSVNFSRGGEDGDGSDISLPPSFWDRLMAKRPRING